MRLSGEQNNPSEEGVMTDKPITIKRRIEMWAHKKTLIHEVDPKNRRTK